MATLPWWEWKRAQKALEGWVRPLIGSRPYSLHYRPGVNPHISFDKQEIVVDPKLPDTLLPAFTYPMKWRATHVPTLKHLQVLMCRASARHEAGHAVFTEVYHHLLRGSIDAWLVNALEDERMEQLLATRSRAAWADFLEFGYALLWRVDGSQSTEWNERLLLCCLLERWNWRRGKEDDRIAYELSQVPPDKAMLWTDKVVPLVHQSWKVASSLDVVPIAHEILKLLELDKPNQRLPKGLANIPGIGKGDVAGERLPGDSTEQGQPVPGLNLQPEAFNVEPEEQAVPEPDGAGLKGKHKYVLLAPYRDLEREVAGQVGRLTRILQVDTPEAGDLPSMHTGIYDIREELRSAGETPLRSARLEAESPEGLAVMVLVDHTTSMGNRYFDRYYSGEFNPKDVWGMPGQAFNSEGGRMIHARRAVMLLVKACLQSRIPIQVGLAALHTYDPEGVYRSSLAENHAIEWIWEWDTPATNERGWAALAGMHGNAGVEAVIPSLKIAVPELLRRPEQTKLLLYIHDGQPHDNVADMLALIDQVRRKGVILLGVYVGDQHSIKKLQAIFGEQYTIGVPKLNELGDRLGRILKRYRR